jgi:hypothetical protein
MARIQRRAQAVKRDTHHTNGGIQESKGQYLLHKPLLGMPDRGIRRGVEQCYRAKKTLSGVSREQTLKLLNLIQDQRDVHSQQD